DWQKKGVLQLRARPRNRLCTSLRPKPFSIALPSRCGPGAESRFGNELSRREDVVVAAAVHWTACGCGLGNVLGLNSCLSFHSGARLSAIALAKPGKRNDP